MCYQIVGRKIETEVVIYEVYTHSKNKLAVVIGAMPQDKDLIPYTIEAFLSANPMFAQKFVYEEFNWPCFEDKKLLVAVFRFRNDNYRIRLSPDQTFFIKKKAIHSEEGFCRDTKSTRRR